MIRGTPRKSAARSHYLSVSSTIHETKSGFQTDLPADTSFSRKEGRKEAVFASDKINSLFSHLPHFTSVQWTLSSSKQQQRRQSGFLLPSHASIRPKSRQTDRPHADFARLRVRRPPQPQAREEWESPSPPPPLYFLHSKTSAAPDSSLKLTTDRRRRL